MTDAKRARNAGPAIWGLLACAIAVLSASALPGGATTALAARAAVRATGGCGSKAPEVLARTAGSVARRIYRDELSGSEVQEDRLQVQEDAALLGALQSGNGAAVKEAVEKLVYSHTHIVRLRVSQGATPLADVGGPYILAPVSGVLRAHGRTIGRYELSVQDDLGYVKLETRFVGAPLVLRTGPRQVPVEGQLTPAPAQIPAHGPVHFKKVAYQAYSFDAEAFPSGPLRVSLLVPLPGGIADMSCAEVISSETGLVAQRISRRFPLGPSNFGTYVTLTQTLTGATTFVRAGSRQLAGVAHGPTRLPDSGTVKFRGVRYEVASFQAPSSVGAIRVYVLTRA
jgi:hypothetical protein